jgi:DNA polymerase epsilon subunit 2
MAAPSAATRRKLQRKFKLRGFTLKVDALEEAAAFLDRFPDAEDDALDLLLDELDKEPRKPVPPLGFRAIPSPTAFLDVI